MQGHNAPITNLNMHPGASQNEKFPEMSELLLTSSMDWTVKLWSPKERSTALFTFESSQEYVYDVQWSPTHPSVFASCDAEGYVDVWDINKDREQPVVRRQIREKDAKPLNCLKWSLDGRRLVCGDASGQVSMLSVDQDLSMGQPEDFAKIAALIQQA